MNIGKILKSIGHVFGGLFSSTNLTAAEKFVADNLPVFGDDLAKFSTSLASEFGSLEALAGQAIKLYKDAKGTTLSKSLAIHLAQAALTAAWPEVEAEAKKLLKLK